MAEDLEKVEMNDFVTQSTTERTARAVAARLSADHGSELLVDVEKALRAGGNSAAPDQFLDPISLGSLIVSVTSLGWAVYADLRRRTPEPPRQELVQRIRLELVDPGESLSADEGQVIDAVVENILDEGSAD
ncbi:hypothetical protein [Nocardia sp. NPDC003183]